MKAIVTWIQGLFRDEKGTPSSKRFIGIIAGLSLCASLFINLFTHQPVDHTLVQAVAALAFGALGLASIDKIWSKDKTDSTDSTN